MSRSDIQRPVVGIAWYRPDNYRRVLEIMVDREDLPGSFIEWRKRAEKALRQLKRQGHIVVRIPLDADEFEQWCRESGQRTDGSARARYASDMVRQHVAKSG